MDKFDILIIAVLVFGAIACYAVHLCYKLFAAVYGIYDILNSHKDALKTITQLMENFQKFTKNQNEFNRCVKDNFDKITLGNSPTGGRRSEAEAL